MSLSQPVERVVTLLGEGSYEPLAQPVTVAGIPFDFSAVLAVNSSLDLVVVVDTFTERDIVGIRRRVEGLCRALDLAESRRPLTVVLVGPHAVPELQLGLTRVARVLVAGVSDDERALRDALAVLLPLDLATTAEIPESWRSARDRLLSEHPDAGNLLEAAKRGSDEVTKVTRRYLLAEPSGEGEAS